LKVRHGWQKFDVPSSSIALLVRRLLLVDDAQLWSETLNSSKAQAQRALAVRNGRQKFNMVWAIFDMPSTSKIKKAKKPGGHKWRIETGGPEGLPRNERSCCRCKDEDLGHQRITKNICCLHARALKTQGCAFLACTCLV
jgi:hypothetical protein